MPLDIGMLVGAALRATAGFTLGNLSVIVSLTWVHYLDVTRVCMANWCEGGSLALDFQVAGSYSWTGSAVSLEYSKTRTVPIFSSIPEEVVANWTREVVSASGFASEFAKIADAAVSALRAGL
jgi:hypothetical protein